MSKTDGGPAFPERYDYERDQTQSWGGMTLRDYAVIHLTAAWIVALGNGMGTNVDALRLGTEQADAMLKERTHD